MNDNRDRNVVTLREFVAEFWDQLTNLESRFFLSLRHLIFQPGRLTSAYLEGDRDTYARPLRLFIVVNVLFFFLGPVLSVFNNDAASYTHGPFGHLAKAAIESQAARSGLDPKVYFERIDTDIRNRAGSMVFITVPIFACFLKLGWRRRHFVEHLIFAVHYLSAFLIVMLLVGLLFQLDGRAILLLPFFLLPATFIALDRVYASRAWVTAIATPLTLAAFAFAYGVFNLSVFWVSIAILEIGFA